MERLYGVVKEVYIPLEYSEYFGTTLGSKCNNNKKSKSVTFSVVTYLLTILYVFLQVFIDSALYFIGNKLLNKGINLE